MDLCEEAGIQPSKSLEAEHSVEHKLISSNSTHETDSGIISVQTLEFKTSLLEAVEELHIHRDSERRYGEQICKLVLEKQELEWQKESLQHQIDTMSKQHAELLSAVKKQFQGQIRGIEVEKGKQQLTVELKDKEIISLKEELKLFQLFKYSLEKKLSELEQKLLLQSQTKTGHLSQLSEVEKRFSSVSRQCAKAKQAFEKLEQNVEEAMQQNKKLASINRKQETTISTLNEDVARLNTQLVKSKVASVRRTGEEGSYLTVQDQQLQLLQRRLDVETELGKKFRTENATEKSEKQEVMKSLQHAQQLLQRQTQALSQALQELQSLREEHQALKTEHELIRERSKGKEESFSRLMEDYERSQITWEKERLMLREQLHAGDKEASSLKESPELVPEMHKQLSSSAVLQTQHIQSSEMKSDPLQNTIRHHCEDQQSALSALAFDVCVDTTDLLGEKASSDNEESALRINLVSEKTDHGEVDSITGRCPQTEAERDVSLERTNSEVKIFAQTNHHRPPPLSPGAPALSPPGIGAAPSGVHVPLTNQPTDPNVKQWGGAGESEPVYGACDNTHPTGGVQSDTAGRSRRLSGPETRSVYGVDCDGTSSGMRDSEREKGVCTAEAKGAQTSDKHTDGPKRAAPQDDDCEQEEAPTMVPETSLPSPPPQTASEMSADRGQAPDVSDTTSAADGGHSLGAAEETPQQNRHPQSNSQVEEKSSDGPGSLSQQHNTPPHCPSLAAPPNICLSFDLPSKHLEDHCSPLRDGFLESKISQRNKESNSDFNPLNDSDVWKGNGCPLGSSSQGFTQGDTRGDAMTAEESQTSKQTLKGQTANVEPSLGLKPSVEVKPPCNVEIPQEDTQFMDPQPSGQPEAERLVVEIDPSFSSGNKRYRSSFELCQVLKGRTSSQQNLPPNVPEPTPASQGRQEPCAPPASTRSSEVPRWDLPSGFQDLLASLNVPLFQKERLPKKSPAVIMRSADNLAVVSLNLAAPSIHPCHKREGERNAITQAFHGISAEKESRCPISFSSPAYGAPAPCPVVNGLRQDSTPTVTSPGLCSFGRTARPGSEGTASNTHEKEGPPQPDIAKIGQLFANEESGLSKRRKMEVQILKSNEK